MIDHLSWPQAEVLYRHPIAILVQVDVEKALGTRLPGKKRESRIRYRVEGEEGQFWFSLCIKRTNKK